MPVVQNRLEGGLAVRVEGLAGGQILPQALSIANNAKIANIAKIEERRAALDIGVDSRSELSTSCEAS
jgi:hypothetical protein